MLINLLSNQYALVAARSLRNANRAFSSAAQHISTGIRLNSAGEDPSSFNLATNLESQLRSLGAAGKNLDDVSSLVQHAEGGLNEIQNSLIRLRELTIQSASDTVSDEWRQGISVEADSIQEDINRIANSAGPHGFQLLNGSLDDLDFQVGTENSPDSKISLPTAPLDVRTSSLGLDDSVNLDTSDLASDSLSAIDLAIGRVADARASTGGFQNRVDTIKHLVTNDYLLGSERLSRLRDTDYTTEITNLFLSEMRQKASIMVLAQANLQSSSVLKLLDFK